MPDRGSGELRLFSLLKILAASHQVTVYTWSWGQEVDDDAKLRYRENLVAEGVVHESLGLRALLQRDRYDAIVFEWYYWVDWYLQDVKTWQPDAKILIDTVDIEFRRLALQAHAAGGYTDAQLREFKRKELAAYQRADMLIAVSTEEAAILSEELPGTEIAVIPNIHIFPETLPVLSADANVIFIGNFRFDPNLDAVRYFCSEIWPGVHAKIPNAKFSIVGNALPNDLPFFQLEGVEAVGYVPDTATYLAQSRVSVAPLRFGAGVKGKVGEAIAAGIPVVTTSIGLQGMPLKAEQDIMIADSPAKFSDSVVRLLTDYDLCERQRMAAWEQLKTEFGFDAIRVRVDAILERVPHLKTEALGLPRRWAQRVKYMLDQHFLWRFSNDSNDLDGESGREKISSTHKKESSQ